MKALLKALGLSVLFILVLHQPASASGPWFVSTYAGMYSPRTYGEILHKSWNLQSEYLAAASVGREMTRLDRVFGIEADLAVEWEGVFATHWGDSRSYQEIAGSLNLRWHRFPWREHLTTSIGTGFGLSYATPVPQHEGRSRLGKRNNLLVYLMYDITIGLPEIPSWAVFFRVHHRSGAFGTFGGVRGASNYPCIGVRYTFH